MTRSAPARRSWPPTIAIVQPEWRRSSSRTPVPGGGVAVILKAPRTLAACCMALAISRWGGRSSVRETSATCGTAKRGGDAFGQPDDHVAKGRRRHARDPGDGDVRSSQDVCDAGDDVVLEGPLAQAALDGRPPAAITEARERPAALSPGVLRDLSHRAGSVGGHLLDLELQRGRAQVSGGKLDQRRVWRLGETWRGADRAATAVARRLGHQVLPAGRASGSARRRRTQPSRPVRHDAGR